MDNIEFYESIEVYADGKSGVRDSVVLKEHELTVIVNETPAFRLVCTKENLKELVTGRLYTEHFINKAEDINMMYFCKYENEVSVFLKNDVVWDESIPLEKSCCTGNRIFQSSRKENLEMVPKLEWQREWIFSLAERFAKDTKLHDITGGTHSCILAQKDKFLFSCEDIGRHNAVDKAVGYGLMTGAMLSECILYTSGRVPVDMVEKVIVAGVPILVSKSVPTAESVSLASEYGLTLICRAYPDRYEIMSN